MSDWDNMVNPARKTLESLIASGDAMADRIEVLEAKLEKAIGALEKVRAFVREVEPYADQGHTLVPALREACETLKELKGTTK